MQATTFGRAKAVKPPEADRACSDCGAVWHRSFSGDCPDCGSSEVAKI